MGWFQTKSKPGRHLAVDQFQSLDWDGVVSDPFCLANLNLYLLVSIPRLGWGGFRLVGVRLRAGHANVSIPRLGWGGFRQTFMLASTANRCCFNPSIGMGWFQTMSDCGSRSITEMFQSLDWDGVVSDVIESSAQNFNG